MKRYFFFILLTLTNFALSSEMNQKVHSITSSVNGPHLVKLVSGEVVFVEKNDPQKLEHFQKRLVKDLSHSKMMMPMETEEEYSPTIVDDSEIQNIFDRMNPFIKRKSECSDRAHVWTWDENKLSGINSQKVFLLLTDTYIRKNRFKWWFHVAPLYTSSSGQKIVMDLQFFDRPVSLEEWKNSLVFSKRECVSDFRFTDYNAGADQTQDCYVKVEPMYYKIPGDIGVREQSGISKTRWNESDVNASRSRAFFKRGL